MGPGVYEAGNTFELTWVNPRTPDLAPRLSVIDSAGTIVHSAYSQTLSGYGTRFFTPLCITSCAWYVYEWHWTWTTAGSAYPSVQRGTFVVEQTQFTVP